MMKAEEEKKASLKEQEELKELEIHLNKKGQKEDAEE